MCARTWQPKHVAYARQLFPAHAGGKGGEERQYQEGVSVTENIHKHSNNNKKVKNLHDFQQICCTQN